jgi:hypothetical protein
VNITRVEPIWRPFWKGLVLAVPGWSATGIDEVRRRKPTAGTNLAFPWTRSGYRSLRFVDASTTSLIYANDDALNFQTNGLTFFEFLRPREVPASTQHNTHIRQSDLTDRFIFRHDVGQSGLTFYCETTSGSINYVNQTPNLIDDVFQTVIARYDGAYIRHAVNNVWRAATTAQTGTLVSDADDTYIGWQSGVGNRYLDADVAVFYLWNRALTDRECYQLHVDPFGPLRLRRRVMVVVESEMPEVTPVTGLAWEQEGYRWRLDDADEDEATWDAAQDTDISFAVGQRRRLRELINATGDQGSAQMQLEVALDGTETWRKVHKP